MKLTYLSLPHEGKEGPSDLETGHPALASGDMFFFFMPPPYPGLALEGEASDGLGETGQVLPEVGQLSGVDLVWAVLVGVPLRLGLLHSQLNS